MPDIVADLKKRYGDTLNAFEAAEMQKAFGSEEAMQMINALYGQEQAVRANGQALEEAVAQGQGFTKAMAADNNFDSKMQLLSQNIDLLQQSIGDQLAPVIETLANKIIKATT